MNHRKRLSALLFAMLLAFLFLSFQKGRVKINALNFADEYFQEENVFLTANQIVPNETGIKDYRRGILVTATKSGGKLDLVDEISGHFEIDLMPYSRLTYSGSEYETASYVNPYQDLNTLSLVFTDAETGKTFKVVITGGAPGNSVTANAHVEAEGKKMGIYYHRDSEALGITAGANSRDVFTFLWGTSFSNMAVRGADYASKNVRSVKIEFDPVTMRVYGHSYGYNTDAEGRKLIWDFSKPENDGFDAGFSLDGFERYNVSLVFENVAAGRQANLLIYEINGQSFENSYLYNSSGPNLYAKPAAGKVNEKYPLPKPLAYDVLEGNLDFDGEVAVCDEKGNKVNVYDSQDRLLSGKFSEGAYFLPEKSGNYRVVYRGYDSEKLPGKELECIVKVFDENVPELVHDLNESHFVKNSPVTLPAGKVLYKGQEYPTTVSVFDPDNQVVASSGGKVNLTKAGRYVFRFQANLPDRGFEDEVEVFVSNPAEGIIQNLSSDQIEFGKADLNSALSGLIVTSSLNNSAIRLKDPLDFTKLNKNDLLVDLLVLPSKWGSSDFDQISIKLTDADDPGNYVLIVFSASDKEIDTTYIRAGAHNQKLAGRTKDGKIATAAGSGTPTLHSFSGQARYLNISEQSLRVYFDYPERKIFTSDNKLVADLDDSEFFVEPWNGFKNGKAYLEIQVSGLNSDKAVYLIKNIGGLNLENKIYLDATAPELEYDESLFVDGLKGRKYPLPEVTAYDKIEGVLPVSVEVRFEGGMVEVSAGGFLPLASGSYLITYTATDAFGNTAVFVKEIEVHDELPPIEVEIEGALGRGHVGTEIAVPGFSARGGAGKLEVSVKAIGLNTGTEYAVVGLRFTPLVADVYKIVYTATDRLGSVSEEFIQVEVIVSERPIIAAPAFIPHIIIDGLETRFSVTTAIDYNQTPAKAVAVEMKLVLEGKEITISDGKHLPQLTQMNSVARLVYRATSPVTGKEAVLEYEIPAIRLYDSYGRLQLAQYFLSEGIDAIEPSRNYIDFTTQTSGAKLTFIKEVAADGFQIVFNVPATANNVDSIIIRMKDAQDPAKTVKFTVRKANSQDAFSYLTINDSSTTTMAGTFFGTTAARLNLYYNNTLFSVSDDNGLPIAYIKTFEDGSPFTGFSSTVNFEIIFENVTGIATLRLQQVGNQLISSVDDDYTVPSISIFGEMVRSAKLNEHVTIPDATAFDVLSFSTSISIRITDPDNQVIYSSNNGKGTKIVVEKYGTYYVTYTATDGNGNPMTMTRAISVLDDVAPEIVLKGKIPTSGKLGSTLKLPEFEVSDNYTENVDTRIFVIDPENVMSVVVNGNVTFAKEGKYTIRYFAIDEAGNMNYLDYVVEVRYNMAKSKNTLFKIWSIIMAALLAFSLAACKGKEHENDPEEPEDFWPEETGEYLMQDGVTAYKLVLPEQAGEKELLAKNELVDFFKKATGVTLEAVSDLGLSFNPEDKYISLGKTKLLQSSGIKVSESELTKDGYIIKTIGNLVFIAGPSDYSALYGAYKFMYYSFKFKVYADDEIQYDKVKDIPLYAFDIKDVPDFEDRELGYFYTTQDLLYGDRMRVRKHGANWIYATHSHFKIMPKARYYADHPDWYSPDGTQLCLTNEEMKAEFIKNVKQAILANPEDEYILLGEEDSNTFCTCERCTEAIRQYGTPSGVDMVFVNSVAEEIERWLAEVDPGRKLYIGTFAYFKTLQPPATYDEATKTWTPNSPEVLARDNVFVFIAPLETNYSYSFLDPKNSLIKNAFEGWSVVTEKFAVWTYSANYFSYFTNFLNFSTQAQQYRELRDLGAISVFDLGPWDTATPTFDKMRIYVASQLLWDADQNVDDLIDDFLRNYYKDAYPAMRKYFDTTRTYLEYLRNLYGLDATCYVNYNKIEYWPKKYLDNAMDILNEALALVDHYREENPVLYEKLVNRIKVESLSPMYFLLRFYQASYTPAEQIAMIDEFERIAKENKVTNWAESTNLTQGDNKISTLVASFRASVK